jgi:imidazolonepropionase-like amidohydrolase
MRSLVPFIAALPLLAADALVIRNVTVHPVSGPEMAGASIAIAGGRITEVGAKIAAPKGAKVIDGRGLHVYPGLIDSATELGLSEISSVRETNDTGELGEFNPQLRAISAVNPASEHIPVIRANGITSAISLPYISSGGGGRGGAQATPIVTGQPALIHLDGWTWEDMAVKPGAAMELVFPSISSGRSRFTDAENPAAPPRTPFAEARRNYEKRIKDLDNFFNDARRYQKAKAAAEPGFKPDLKFEAMLPVLDGKLPVMINANRERHIKDALAFADRQKIRMVLAGPREFGSTIADLKAKNIPVILGPTLALPVNEDEPYDSAFTLPAELHKAGIKFAFGTFGNQFSRNLPYQASAAVAFGLPYDEALKALTINAAEIWGVASEVGSIEKGKWADLMVTDGDPLEARTQVKMLFIQGRQVDLESRHTRLYEKYLNRP